MSVEIKNFGIAIIESLRSEDTKTGTELCSSILKYKEFEEPNFKTYFYSVKNREDFFNALSGIYAFIKDDVFMPIIQFEMHGYSQGVELTSGEIVSWEELLNKCREINQLMSNNLILMMSVCEGVSIISYIDPSDRAPFGAIIGTTRTISAKALLDSFQAFYNHFLFSFDFAKSVELMNSEIDSTSNKFYILTSDQCFDSIVDPDRDQQNLKKMMKHLVTTRMDVDPTLKGKNQEQINLIIEKEIRQFFADLKSNKNYFVMEDLKK